MSDQEKMRSFWNEKAGENPLWYVASNLEYSSPDERRFWESGEEEVATAVAAAGMERGRLAVDIGCGVGRLSRPLARRFDAVRSFDVSTKMVELATENLAPLGNVTVTAVDGTGSVPLPDAAADLVLSLQVFQHIPSRAITLAYIREAGRLLATGGRFVFQLRSLRSQGRVAGRIERVVRGIVDAMRRRLKPPPKLLDSPAWHGSRVGKWEIEGAARAGGMGVVAMRWISKTGASLFVVCEKR